MLNIKKFIKPNELLSIIHTENALAIFDVRRLPAFEEADRMIAGAIWRDHQTIGNQIADLPEGKQVVVYCVHSHQVSQTAAALLQLKGVQARVLDGGIHAWEEAGGTTISREKAIKYQGSPWVTRENPKIDRIACPWLIRRFIDSKADIHYVSADWVQDIATELKATAFDINAPDLTFTHDGEYCSFDAFIRYFDIRDPALDRMATIIRGADTARLDIAPQAAGLVAFSLGLSAICQDDFAMLEKGMYLYDALYSWCRNASNEAHSWAGKMA